MGFIAKLLSFTRVTKDGIKLSDVKMDPDGGSNITGAHFADAGDDAFPLSSDYVAAMSVRRSGGKDVVGYADPINDPKAAEGEKRIYGRDPSTGLEVCEVWLKADGAILLSNSNGNFELKADGSQKGDNSSGSFELEAGGDFVINGVTIDASGNIVTAGGAQLNADGTVKDGTGKDLGTHVHPGVTSGPSSTGPPV